MIEFWQVAFFVLSLWVIYYWTIPVVRPSVIDIQFKHFIEDETINALRRDKQQRIRLGLEPVIKT
ncbi:hypothetical protein LCGC14_0372310 [marine sediment metagenome]|uniref:Uncharacterized protein n=1 Tax=marine sediment metagenome TaxID=412755 RepID=A0A0F9T4S6_9ZZZZ